MPIPKNRIAEVERNLPRQARYIIDTLLPELASKKNLPEAGKRIDSLDDRMTHHSLYIINTILTDIQRLRETLDELWISADRFTELEKAIATLAGVVHGKKAGKPDSRIKPRNHVRRNRPVPN